MPKFLSEHFTLEEMVFSQSAARLGIDNTPPEPVLHNLRRLCRALEMVRQEMGELPVIVSSGYRSPALNVAVGGAEHSKHMQGLAVDFTVPRYGSTLQVARTLAGCGLQYDQLIHEYGRWVHLALAPEGVAVKGEKLSIFAGTGYLDGLRAAPPTA
ncbi:MAG: hypothetical protein AVDCRST_MAG51-1854 [uncultured Ramlibacter sp.]|uniref:Peptidase M15A C-terminal domain-containing protein n=1 Tax=uncultured Ramlibacter sp. TaxID=260755 RepID=A0A6J4PJM5_9BURK|nr:MAG: hypothetical protein AVDCRST_MAG51-1854 [uncultured Ramlibacter sp.]